MCVCVVCLGGFSVFLVVQRRHPVWLLKYPVLTDSERVPRVSCWVFKDWPAFWQHKYRGSCVCARPIGVAAHFRACPLTWELQERCCSCLEAGLGTYSGVRMHRTPCECECPPLIQSSNGLHFNRRPRNYYTVNASGVHLQASECRPHACLVWHSRTPQAPLVVPGPHSESARTPMESMCATLICSRTGQVSS